MQQRKLAERREAKYRAERGPQEARMLSELRTRMTQVRGDHLGGRERGSVVGVPPQYYSRPLLLNVPYVQNYPVTIMPFNLTTFTSINNNAL